MERTGKQALMILVILEWNKLNWSSHAVVRYNRFQLVDLRLEKRTRLLAALQIRFLTRVVGNVAG